MCYSTCKKDVLLKKINLGWRMIMGKSEYCDYHLITLIIIYIIIFDDNNQINQKKIYLKSLY